MDEAISAYVSAMDGRKERNGRTMSDNSFVSRMTQSFTIQTLHFSSNWIQDPRVFEKVRNMRLSKWSEK